MGRPQAERAPRWRCKVPGCRRGRWQPVSAMGEYDPLDAALADLETHYRRAHPDLADDDEQEEVDGHALAA